MCGIFGIAKLKACKAELDTSRFQEAMMQMKHRGPDANGYKVFDDKLCLGHLRLSIIDLDESNNQPFSVDDRYWISFNGEIFNYIEIRAELMAHGYDFNTKGDTEVLVKAYQHWGESCVQRFNGMWAFAIYDQFEDTLFCSRDRFGVKPFNYAVYDDQFIFSSEVKSIIHYFPSLKEPNYNVIANFCRSSSGAQHVETWFKDVIRLMPGHNLLIAKGVVQAPYRYWFYPTEIDSTITFEKAKEIYRDLFIDAVQLRMRSDVPVGTTLSSGLDSTSIIGALRTFYEGEHQSFTAAFDSSKYDATEKAVYKDKNIVIDEASLVQIFAMECNLKPNFVSITYDEGVEELRKIIFHLESGNSSPAVLPLMKVLETAKKQKVKVVLEGQGADELLGGYITSVFGTIVLQLLSKMKIKDLFQFYKVFGKNYPWQYSVLLFFRTLSNDFPIIQRLYNRFSGIESIFGPKLRNYDKLNDFPDYEGQKSTERLGENLRRQHSGGLVNLLHYGDAISMAHSLESRLPFMDYRLVEFAFKLPWQYKVNMGLGKYIHRKAIKGIIPDYILDNPLKFGFTTPISQFFKREFKADVSPLSILTSKKFLERGLFKEDEFLRLIDKHNRGKGNYGNLLFRILSVEIWFNIFIDK